MKWFLRVRKRGDERKQCTIVVTYWNSSLKSSGGTDPNEYDIKVVVFPFACGSHGIVVVVLSAQ